LKNQKRPVSRVVASPLLRTRESAEHVEREFNLSASTDERLIEPWNNFEGRKLGGLHILVRPHLYHQLRNPQRPSWGEPFEEIASRMLEAMDRATEGRKQERPTVARFKATGRAYVEFALDHPELYRVLFSGSGVVHMPSAAATLTIPTPYQLLSRALDALAADGLLPADRRPGAELKAWSVVHGFATLALTGQGRIPAGRQRHEALESTLEFATLGLCSPPLPRRTPKAR
jgi:hypothetical protein